MTKSRNFATAVHIMTALAYAETLTSQRLAASVQTNPGLVRRVLAKLVRSGLVEAQRGKSGGSRLARPPSQISLREIYEAVEDGPLLRVSGKQPHPQCVVSCNIQTVLEDVFTDAEEAMKKRLGGVKLSRVLNQVTA